MYAHARAIQTGQPTLVDLMHGVYCSSSSPLYGVTWNEETSSIECQQSLINTEGNMFAPVYILISPKCQFSQKLIHKLKSNNVDLSQIIWVADTPTIPNINTMSRWNSLSGGEPLHFVQDISSLQDFEFGQTPIVLFFKEEKMSDRTIGFHVDTSDEVVAAIQATLQ
jgi:hypothetical protein